MWWNNNIMLGVCEYKHIIGGESWRKPDNWEELNVDGKVLFELLLNRVGIIWYDIYLLQLGFHPVVVQGKIVYN